MKVKVTVKQEFFVEASSMAQARREVDLKIRLGNKGHKLTFTETKEVDETPADSINRHGS
jgi:hypothetical protein